MNENFSMGFNANLAPDAFLKWSKHYLKCESDFKSPDSFSPIPYFLLGRSIELSLKSIYLKSQKQSKVRNTYGHDLLKAFRNLPPNVLILENPEITLLEDVSNIYKGKGFEYYDPEDILTGFSRYPDLNKLRLLAKKIISAIS